MKPQHEEPTTRTSFTYSSDSTAGTRGQRWAAQEEEERQTDKYTSNRKKLNDRGPEFVCYRLSPVSGGTGNTGFSLFPVSRSFYLCKVGTCSPILASRGRGRGPESLQKSLDTSLYLFFTQKPMVNFSAKCKLGKQEITVCSCWVLVLKSELNVLTEDTVLLLAETCWSQFLRHDSFSRCPFWSAIFFSWYFVEELPFSPLHRPISQLFPDEI
jgi:hypothetical protein